ncbi:MAG: vitamin K epoxide reductase family protein [Armatimonadota bacterium]
MTNRVVFVLSLIGVQVAGYLTLAHLNVLQLVCGRLHGCNTVAQHPTAHGFGIPALSMVPTAAFGFAFFGLLMVLCSLRAAARSRREAWGIGAVQWGVSLMGVTLSGWLTFLEEYVINAWCLWCLASAAIVLLIFITVTVEMLLSARPPRADFEEVSVRYPREVPRFLMIVLVALLFDGSAVWALHRSPMVNQVQVAEETSMKKSSLILPGAHLVGKPTAPYTLVEFGDYICPHCQIVQPAVEKYLAKYPDGMNFVFYYCPILDDPDGPPALAARAVEAAAAQGKFFEMHTRVFKQLHLEPASSVRLDWVLKTAKALGLDMVKFQADLDSPAIRQAIKQWEDLAEKVEIDGVPTFFIIEPSGKTTRIVGDKGLEKWFAEHGTLQASNRQGDAQGQLVQWRGSFADLFPGVKYLLLRDLFAEELSGIFRQDAATGQGADRRMRK